MGILITEGSFFCPIKKTLPGGGAWIEYHGLEDQPAGIGMGNLDVIVAIQYVAPVKLPDGL